MNAKPINLQREVIEFLYGISGVLRDGAKHDEVRCVASADVVNRWLRDHYTNTSRVKAGTHCTWAGVDILVCAFTGEYFRIEWRWAWAASWQPKS